MTGRQELMQEIVRTVAVNNYRAWRLGIGDPDEKTQKQIAEIRELGGRNLLMTTYDETNIYVPIVGDNSLSLLISYETRSCSQKARDYYMNCTDKTLDRFCNEVLREVNKKVDGWKWAHEINRK